MISIAPRDVFGSFTFAAFTVKNIPVVVAVMIIPSLIESSMFFFQSEPLSFIEYFSKAYDGILVVDPVFH